MSWWAVIQNVLESFTATSAIKKNAAQYHQHHTTGSTEACVQHGACLRVDLLVKKSLQLFGSNSHDSLLSCDKP